MGVKWWVTCHGGKTELRVFVGNEKYGRNIPNLKFLVGGYRYIE